MSQRRSFRVTRLERLVAWIFSIGIVTIVSPSPLKSEEVSGETFLRCATFSFDKNGASQKDGVLRVEWKHVNLEEVKLAKLRDLLIEALRRIGAANAKASREGVLKAGVPGCVSYEFRLSFACGEDHEQAFIHLCDGWMDGPRSVGFLVFTNGERARFKALVEEKK